MSYESNYRTLGELGPGQCFSHGDNLWRFLERQEKGIITVRRDCDGEVRGYWPSLVVRYVAPTKIRSLV